MCQAPPINYDKLGFEIGHHDETYAFAHRDKDLTIHLTLSSISTVTMPTSLQTRGGGLD
jgi:hypothetical protein